MVETKTRITLSSLSLNPAFTASVSFMAFHHRKLLHHGSPAPSPHQSPPPPLSLPEPLFPLPLPPYIHVKALPLAMIAVASMSFVFTLLCSVSVILRRCYYTRRRNNNDHGSRNTPILFDVSGDNDNDNSPVSDDDDRFVDHPIWFIRTVGLQQSAIDSITVFKYRKDEGLIDGTECSVCLGEFEQDESLRLLPKCSHAFHIPCIDTWLRSHKNCPLCRAHVFNDVVDGSGSASDIIINSNVSGENHENLEAQIENFDAGVGSNNHVGESESSVMSIGDDDSGISCTSGMNVDKVWPNSLAEEGEGEIQHVRWLVSMDLSAASTIFHDVSDLLSDQESSDTDSGDKIKLSCKEVMSIGKQHGSGSSNNFNLASIGRVLQKRPVSMRRSFSHNRKSLFSRHCRSQSSTLPL